MKLHLPKLLLTAVLAAVCYTPAWATSVAPADSATAAENDLLWSYVDGTVGGTFTTATNAFTNLVAGGGQANSDTTRVKLEDINSTTGGFTVSFDLLAASVNNWCNILSMCTLNGTNEASIQKNDSGGLMIYAGSFGGGTGSGDVNMGNFADMVGKTLTFTFDGTTLAAYVNGEMQTSITYTYNEGTSPQGGLSDLYFAAAKGGDRKANVTYNNVGVWSSAMTGEEVAAIILAEYTYTTTLTGSATAAEATWTIGDTAADFANITSRDTMVLNGGEGGGTLVLSDALSVKSVNAASGSVTLQSDSSIVSTTMEVAANASLTLAADTTVGELKTGSQSSLAVAADQTLTAGAIVIADDTSSISIAKGAVLDLSSLSLPDVGEGAQAMQLIKLINKTSGEGTVKLANAANYINSGPKKKSMTFDTNYEVGTDASASLHINSWHDEGSWKTHTLTEDGSITVGGGAGVLELQTGQKLLIEGGSVAAGQLALGHTSDAAAYSGAVEMTSGSLTVGEIKAQNIGKDSWKNTILLTGGTLTITGSEAITYATTARTDSTLGGSGDSALTLKTAGTDWSVSKGSTEGNSLTIGNITIDAANTNMITINSAALTGDIQNNATAEGAGLTLSGDFTVEGSTTITETEMTENGYSTISTDISIDCFKGNGNYVFSDSLTFNGIAISDYTKSGNTFTYSTGEQTGTIYHVVSADLTVDGSETNAAVDATGYKVYSGRTLTIAANQSDTMTASKILAETVGEGNITVSTGAAIGNGVATLATGTLTVNNGATLAVGEGTGHTSSIASFGAVSLDGGTLRMHNNGSTVNNLTVASESTLHIQDAANANSTTKLAGTTTLNAELNVTSSFKGTLTIDKLTGTGNLDIDAGDNGYSDTLLVNINGLSSYSGVISYKSSTGVDGAAKANNIVNIKNMDGSNYAGITMGGLTLEGGSDDIATANVDIGRNAVYGANSLGAVTMSGGSVLNMFNRGGEGLVNMTSLTVAGTATIGTVRNANCHNGTINIGELSNTGDSAELTLRNGSQTDAATVYNLSGTSSMTGTINVQSDAYRGSTNMSDAERSRKLQVNLNSKEVAANAVINFQDATTLGDANGSGETNNVASNYNILGVGVDVAKVAGLTGETTNAATVKSTEGNRTLEIVGSGTYTTNAKVESNVKLLKSGSGTQNFSGDMSAFNGTVEVSGGTLGFTKADGDVTVSSLTLSGGTLNVAGSLTLDTLSIDLTKYTAGLDTTYTLVEAGSLALGSGVSLENLGGNVGDYTATVAQSGNSITLSFSEIVAPDTSITTTTVTSFGDITTEGMLTLNVGADLTGATKVLISGISDSIMAEILGDANLPEGGMVGITLVGTDKDPFVASAELVVGFQGKDGVYYGEAGTGNVGWVYQAAYIPEPTTATLSLLALAGLAMRRRRKA